MIKYRDFSIRLSESDDETIRVEIDSPAGQGGLLFELPSVISKNIEQQIAAIGKTMGVSATRAVYFGNKQTEKVDPEQFGKDLFDAVFQGTVKRLLERSQEMTSAAGEGLRIRFTVDPFVRKLAQINRLPWELMCWPDTGEFLGLSNRSPMVRFLEVPRAFAPIPFRPPFRILVVISNPSGVATLDLAKERTRIKESWGRRSDVQVDYLESATISELQRQLGEADYHALHFMGHGDFDEQTGRGVLILEKEDGSAEHVSGEALGVLMADEPTLRLAFLNACNTAQSSDSADQNPFSGVASALVMAGIPAVVAMQFPITDEAAIAFANTFYELLPQCHPVDYIVTEARKSVYQLQEGQGGMEWATPALFMRSPDGVVFESVYRLEPLSGKDSNAYSRLGSKVRKFWIEGKLDFDVPIKPPIELDKELVPQAIQKQMPGDEQEEVPAGKTTATLFDEKERSLLILGEAGYGKTITLLALAQHLLKRFEQDRSQPIPVVLFLSTWGDSKLTIQDWAAREVFEKYKISDKLCKEWIDDGRIVLLLDGLDELSEEQRVKCVEAINIFSDDQIRRTNFHGVAVCCRFDDYEKLPIRFDFESAIRLRPLTSDQIMRYLAMFGESMAGLEACLEREPMLLEDAKSPLMLGMLSVAYNLNPGEFSVLTEDASAETDRGSRTQLVVDAYLDRAFQRYSDDSAPFSRAVTTTSLGWLAKRLKEHRHSLFLIESIQPDWLRNVRERILSNVLFGLILGFLIATAMSIIWDASVAVDPPVDPSIQPAIEASPEHPARVLTSIKQPTVDAHNWWYLIGPIWVFVAAMWEGWQIRRFIRLPHVESVSRTREILHYASVAAMYYVFWICLWLTILLIIWLTGRYVVADDEAFWQWLSHPIQGGIAVAILYALRGRGPNTSTYIGTSEALRWSWRRGAKGMMMGLALGGMLWCASLLFEDLASLTFYLPLWSVVGLLFGGLKMDAVKTKALPNEGIILSLRNSLMAAGIVGPIIGIALVYILMVSFPFTTEGFQEITATEVSTSSIENLRSKCVPAFKLGVAVTLISFLWFGGIDVIRHYALRLTLRLTGQLPLKLPALFDHASDLALLQCVGGGYIFRNHLLRDHFERLSLEFESNEDKIRRVDLSTKFPVSNSDRG